MREIKIIVNDGTYCEGIGLVFRTNNNEWSGSLATHTTQPKWLKRTETYNAFNLLQLGKKIHLSKVKCLSGRNFRRQWQHASKLRNYEIQISIKAQSLTLCFYLHSIKRCIYRSVNGYPNSIRIQICLGGFWSK